MKKLLLLPLMAVAMFLGATPASSTDLPIQIPDLPGPTPQLKVDICHNGTVVPVSINAVLTAQDTGHGLLTLLPGLPPSFTFVAHVEGQGHATDTVLRIYLKAGNTETNIVVASGTCDPPPPPDPLVRVCINGEVETILASVAAELGLTVLGEGAGCPETPPTTVTTVVEKEVIKEVEKIVEVPVPGPTMVIERTVTVPAPAAPAPAAPPAPAQELPRTGSGSILTLLGAGLTSTGLIIRRLFK